MNLHVARSVGTLVAARLQLLRNADTDFTHAVLCSEGVGAAI